MERAFHFIVSVSEVDGESPQPLTYERALDVLETVLDSADKWTHMGLAVIGPDKES